MKISSKQNGGMVIDTVRAADIAVLTDFEGATLGSYSITGSTISATLREEPLVKSDGIAHDYNWHFCFGVENLSTEEQLVTVRINCESSDELDTPAYILTQTDVNSDFYPLEQCAAKTDTYRRYFISFSLEPGQKQYISNTYFRTLSNVSNCFDSLCADNPLCTKEVFGSSVEGRDLVSYSISNQKGEEKPRFLVSSGFHPMEADTYGTQSIMAYLASDDGSRLLGMCDFVFVPVVNPDGFAHGYNGCNVNGVNLYWDFRTDDRVNAPESYFLWNFVRECVPNVYVDFHAYTFQLHRKKDAPYIKPLYLYGGREVKSLVKNIDADLCCLHDGRAMNGQITFAPSTLSFLLTDTMNTITYAKYHLHICDGLDHLKTVSRKVVTLICGHLIRSQVQTRKQMIYKPYGALPIDFVNVLCRKTRVGWYYFLKPMLRHLVAGFRRKQNDC